MLNNLPAEVILNVTTFLDLKARLKLILTCKKLYLLISDKTLFQELSLCDDPEEIEAIVEKFENKTVNGHQVKQLSIVPSEIPDDIFRKLALVFPNISILYNEESTFIPSEKKTEDVLNAILPWKDNIRKLDTWRGYNELVTLLESNVFPNLTYLSISPYETSTLVRKPIIRLFECLANAPSLLHLSLYNMTVHIKFLEELHARFPQLKYLNLDSLIINTNKDEEFALVEPASQLLSLKVGEYAIVCDKRCLFLNYIVAKYKKLENLELAAKINHDWEDIRTNFHYTDEHDIEYIGGMHEEQCHYNTIIIIYHYSIRLLTLNLLNLVDDDDIERHEMMLLDIECNHVYTRRSYAEEGSIVFSRLPSTIKQLDINTDVFKDLTKELEKADIQPKELKIDISQCLQEIEFFQKWTQLTTLLVTTPGDFSLRFGSLVSNTVTDLTLCSSYKIGKQDILINRVLAAFPSLEKLDISMGHYGSSSFISLCTDDNDTLTEALYPKLRYLRLGCTLFNPKVSDFLSHCLPNLKKFVVCIIVNKFSWKAQTEIYKDIPLHHIYLDNVRLEKLKISVSIVFAPDYFTDNRDLREIDQRIYLEVEEGHHAENEKPIDQYTFRNDPRRKDTEFTLMNGRTIDDFDKRIKLLLSHTGTIKKIIVCGHELS